MSTPIVLSREAFDTVLTNLVRLEERKEDILHEYCPTPCRERSDLIELLDGYVARLGRILGSVVVRDSGPAEFPYVVIGGSVTLRESGGPGFFTHRLIGPLDEKVGFDDVSLLSPLGKALVLRKTGDKIAIKAPGGDFAYRICTVTLDAVEAGYVPEPPA